MRQYGSRLIDIVREQDRTIVESAVSYVLDGQEPIEFDFRLAGTRDGDIRIHCRLSAQEGKRGRYILCEMADISRYHEKESFYRSILDSQNAPLLITDTARHILFMNKAAERESGFLLNDIVGQTCDIFRTEFGGTSDCCFDRWKRGEKTRVHALPDGRSIRDDYSLLCDEEGRQIGYTKVSTDITELIRTADDLRVSEERYRLALAQTHDSIWDYDIVTDTLHQTVEQAHTDKDYLGIGPALENASRHLTDSKSIPDDTKLAIQTFRDTLVSGKAQAQTIVRLPKAGGGYRWIQIFGTNIYDAAGKPIRAIAVSKDITKEKEREQEFEQERQYRYSVTYDAIASYEVDLTDDTIIYADPYLLTQLKTQTVSSFTDLVQATKEQVVAPEFKQKIEDTIGRAALLQAYEQGKRDIQYEYLRKNFGAGKGNIWVRTYASLIKSTMTGHICAFVYTKDIDRQKRRELELQKSAERDILTGLYNRKTIMELIEKYLAIIHPNTFNALMMIDIDNFKEINDTFGHIYGDAVLSDIAYKLRKTTSPQDIVGRLGGDEFIAMLRNYPSNQALIGKVEQIASTLQMVYSSGNRECDISASIGLIFTPEFGVDLRTLYERVDIALYNSKIQGRNRYSVYSPTMGESLQSMERTFTVTKETSSGKNFIDHITEYVFKILYRSEDLEAGILSILELVSRHFEAQRSYISLHNERTDSFDEQFKWIDKNALCELETAIDTSTIVVSPAYLEHFSQDGMIIIEDTDQAPADIREITDRDGTKAYMQSTMMEEGVIEGFLGVDYLRGPRQFSQNEIETLKTTTEIIGIFLQNKRHEEETKRYVETLQTLMDNMPSGVYVVDPETFKLIFINKTTLQWVPDAQVGDFCYRRFANREEPCPFCPIKHLTGDFESTYTIQRLNERFKRWLETSAINIRWPDGNIYCLLNSIDITDYIELGENGILTNAKTVRSLSSKRGDAHKKRR